VNLLSWLRKSAPKTCRCGHNRRAHDHYTATTNCALCDCKRWRGRRYSATELAALSRTDIPEWPYARRVPPSGEVAWEAVMRAVNGEPPPSKDPFVTDPQTPQQGEGQ
jgi:hypothetical protein